MAVSRKKRLDFARIFDNPENHGEFPAGLGVNIPGERLIDTVADGRPSRLDQLKEQLQDRLSDLGQYETALRVTGAGIGLLIGVGVGVVAYNRIRQGKSRESSGDTGKKTS